MPLTTGCDLAMVVHLLPRSEGTNAGAPRPYQGTPTATPYLDRVGHIVDDSQDNERASVRCLNPLFLNAHPRSSQDLKELKSLPSLGGQRSCDQDCPTYNERCRFFTVSPVQSMLIGHIGVWRDACGTEGTHFSQ